jgi:hypothetical protein
MLGKPIIYWDGLFVCGTKPQRKNRQWHWVWSILTFCKQFLDCHNNFTACIAHSLARTTCLFTSHGVTKFPFTCLLVLRSCGYYSNWNDLSLFLPQQKGIWSDVNTNWDFLLDHLYLFETYSHCLIKFTFQLILANTIFWILIELSLFRTVFVSFTFIKDRLYSYHS